MAAICLFAWSVASGFAESHSDDASQLFTPDFCATGSCAQPRTVSLLQKFTQPITTESHRASIADLFVKSGTDKGFRHGYHRYYETQLAPYRDLSGVRILEIGADEGKSLATWMEYFTSPAAVQGVAYAKDPVAAKSKACAVNEALCEKLSIYSLDQSDTKALSKLIEANPEGWDIIIDDGSHMPPHQLITFQRLWPNIRPGGLYAIEDMETSYMDNGYVYNYSLHGGAGVPPPDNAVEHFKKLVDVINGPYIGRSNLTVFDGVDKDVASVTFGGEIIFVQKKPADPQWDVYPDLRIYNESNNEKTYTAYNNSVAPLNTWFRSLPSQ